MCLALPKLRGLQFDQSTYVKEVGVTSLRRGQYPLSVLAVLLVGCSPQTTAVGTATPPSPTAGASAQTPDSLVGRYSVQYRTTESDREAVTDEVIVRAGEVTGSCSGSQCDLEFTTEIKAPDGSVVNSTTRLTFDGSVYQGTQTATTSCDGFTTLTTIEEGIEYRSETTVTPSATTVEDGRTVVSSFDVVIIERNEVTPAGRDAGCQQINLSGPDPFVSNATVVGVGMRQP